jgi:translation initiation factor IF-1
MGAIASVRASIVPDLRNSRDNPPERIAEAVVVELLPSALVRVKLEGEHELVAHFPSTQRANFVRLRVGDRVRVALSVQDRTRGRILELLRKG